MPDGDLSPRQIKEFRRASKLWAGKDEGINGTIGVLVIEGRSDREGHGVGKRWDG